MSKKGFTLIELIMYTAIVSLITVGVGSVFISVNKGGSKSYAQAEVSSDLRKILNMVSNDVKMATALTAPARGVGPSSKLTLTAWSTSITYELDSDGFVRRTQGNDTQILNSENVKVTSLNFQRIENPNLPTLKVIYSVRTDMTGEYRSTSQDLQYSESRSAVSSMAKFLGTPPRNL